MTALPSAERPKSMRTPHAARPPYAVFCVQEDGAYAGFIHEADAMIYVLGHAVQQGTMTDEEAFEAWSRYSHLWPALYRRTRIKEWQGFPIMGESLDYDEGPGTTAFIAEAERLTIAGVGSESSPIYYYLTVDSWNALDQLGHALREQYRIVVLDSAEFTRLPMSVDEAQRLIDRRPVAGPASAAAREETSP